MPINRITIIGTAYPPEQYPNPVLVTRKVYLFLQALDQSELVDMSNLSDVMAHISNLEKTDDNTVLLKWLETKPEDYLRGIGGGGFEIKRYSCFLTWEDGTRTVFREDEDSSVLVRYADEVKQNFVARKYILGPTDDKKGTLVSREVRDPQSGQKVLKRYCELRVKMIPARNTTSAETQRYPSPSQVALEKAAAEAKGAKSNPG